ncbi:MAG TPA: PDC sensor domain-containing protein [Gemmatimonadales bacterium]|nr:PDC sensor domain-containing protein [Gemmatimonadales bacterium]
MKSVAAVVLMGALASFGAGAAAAQGHTGARPLTRAQQLVNRTVAAHPELAGLELALATGGVCKTVAATAPEDIGERCDADELGPMRTGEPDVEAPSASDPVYDITQALHDSAGRLIGAVGMDLKPATGQDRAAMVAKARAILGEMEAAIPSKGALLQPAPSR